MTQGRLILHGIVPSDAGAIAGSMGSAEVEVFSIPAGPLAAIVSTAPAKVRAERRQLAAHNAVLRRLLEEGVDVLPVSFGMVSDGRAAVEDLVSRNVDRLSDEMAAVAGRVEMSLRLLWDVPNVAELLVEQFPVLGQLRDRIFAPGRTPARSDMVELGRLYEQLRDQARDALAERLEEIVRPACSASRVLHPARDNDAVNLACLVSRERRASFEALVEGAADAFEARFVLELTGPFAPFSFVELRLEA